ncbi:hypothetical protein [Yinghuangia sp. YIM S09857]|uniref:hypothetical protein n=1 Tax=Yinghuangia sp. YIM S09857 TaxID=3436929 RepID=UPI003F5359BC
MYPASRPGDSGTPPGPPGYGQAVTPPRPPAPPAAAPSPSGVADAPPQYGGYGAQAAPSYAPADSGYPPQPQFGDAPRTASSPGGPGGLGGPGGPGGRGGRPPRGGRPGGPAYGALRGTVAFLCLLLAVLLTIPAISASWLKGELISDSGFADNAAELIEKPAIRDEIQSRIASEVMNQAGIPQSYRTMVISSVGAVMATDEFKRVWKEGAATAHSVVVGTLLGKDSQVTEVEGDSLTIKVQTPLDPLFAELAEAGVNVDRAQLPTEIPVSLADIPESGPAQDALKGVDDAGWMLPALAIGLFVAGIAVAVRRLRALALAAMGTLVASGVLLVATNLARSPVVDEATKSSTMSSEATGAVYDVFTDSLITSSWIVVVISLVALAGAAVAGAVLRSRRESAAV